VVYKTVKQQAPTSVRIPPVLLSRLQTVAARKGVTRTAVLLEAIEQYLKPKPKAKTPAA